MNLFNHWKEILIGAVLGLSGPIAGKAMSQTVDAIKHEQPIKYGTISKTEVFWMYTMKTRFWEDGTKITVFYLPLDSKTHKDFVASVLHVTSERFERNVNTYINTGNAAYFRRVDDERKVVSEVAKVPGAIGYVSSEYVVINKGGVVQKLRIEG